jgi:hypothetical protein
MSWHCCGPTSNGRPIGRKIIRHEVKINLIKSGVDKFLGEMGCVILEKQRRQNTPEGPIPNPNLKLLDQVGKDMRFRHYSLRTEQTCRECAKRKVSEAVTWQIARLGNAPRSWMLITC